MNISELSAEERVALMGLLKLTVSADHEMSPGESNELLRIADEMGRPNFIEARKDAQDQFKSLDDIKAALAAVTRVEARNQIYRAALEVAKPDDIVEDEAFILRWVAETWGLSVDPKTFALLD